MPETADQPVAVRATAFIRPSRWLHRPVRLVRYDAYWADGRVDFGVSLSKMMYRGYPGGLRCHRRERARPLPGSGNRPVGGRIRQRRRGTRRTWSEPARKRGEAAEVWGFEIPAEHEGETRVASRLRKAGLGLGVFLTAGPISDGIAGFVGVHILRRRPGIARRLDPR